MEQTAAELLPLKARGHANELAPELVRDLYRQLAGEGGGSQAAKP
jgi:hypothetical protein